MRCRTLHIDGLTTSAVLKLFCSKIIRDRFNTVSRGRVSSLRLRDGQPDVVLIRMLELGRMDAEEEKKEEQESRLLVLPQTSKATRQPPTRRLETLSWEISYSVGSSGSRRLCQGDKGAKSSRRDILTGLVGEAAAGDLVAVMGASGCGKTTFLSCLALRTQRFEGNVYLNRKAVDQTFLPLVGFLDQHDMFVPTLTVREHLNFHVMVRLDASISQEARMGRVESLLEEFNLLDVVNSYIGGEGSLIRGLSQGERKRLFFATELLSDPYIIIADEPTTGLDTLLAANVAQTLRDRADSGHIVICTIHQPSSKAFHAFTRVLLLALGRTVYYGPMDTLVSHFSSIGSPCPESHNPADFVVQRIAIPAEHREEATQAVEGLIQHYEASALAQSNQAWRSTVPESVRRAKRTQVFSRQYSAPFLTQLRYNLVRRFKADMGDARILAAKMGVALFLGLLFGFAYRPTPGPMTKQKIIDRLGLYFISTGFVTTVAILLVARSLPRDLHLFLRERMAGVNRVSTHYLATVMACLPSDLVWTVVFSIPLFLLAIPDISFQRFSEITGILTLLYLSTASLGYFLSAVTMNESVALALLPPVAMPMILFAGLLVNVPDVPWPLRWLEYLALPKYAFHVLVIQDFDGFLLDHCPNGEASCHTITGDTIIHQVNAEKGEQTFDLAMLAIITVVFHALAFVSLWRKAKTALK